MPPRRRRRPRRSPSAKDRSVRRSPSAEGRRSRSPGPRRVQFRWCGGNLDEPVLGFRAHRREAAVRGARYLVRYGDEVASKGRGPTVHQGGVPRALPSQRRRGVAGVAYRRTAQAVTLTRRVWSGERVRVAKSRGRGERDATIGPRVLRDTTREPAAHGHSAVGRVSPACDREVGRDGAPACSTSPRYRASEASWWPKQDAGLAGRAPSVRSCVVGFGAWSTTVFQFMFRGVRSLAVL